MKGRRAVVLKAILMVAASLAGSAAAGASDLEAKVNRDMAAFTAMDLPALEAAMTEDVTAFETDLEGRPARLGSRAEAIAWIGSIFADLEAMGASLALKDLDTRCHAGSTLAYCTAEFSLEMTLADGAVMTQPLRNTVVLRRVGDDWKWAHWQSASAEAPPAAPETP